MKTLYFLAALAALPLFASAQAPTLTVADAPGAGNTFVDVYDFSSGQHQITPAGPSQTWNYSTAFMATDTIVTSFIPVSSVPPAYSTDFQSADMATYTPSDSMAMFFKKNATGFYMDGMGVDTAHTFGTGISSANYNPDLLMIPYPFTFGDTRTHTARMVVQAIFPGSTFPTRYALTTYQTFTADAHGSLTTPAGSYPNTLRVKLFSYERDTTYTNFGFGWIPVDNTGPRDTTITYSWYQNGTNAPLMTISEDPANPNTSLYASYLSSTMVAAPELISGQPAVQVYPNPANNRPVTFDFSNADAHTLIITDMLGRLVQTENIKGLNSLSVGTYGYNSGTYVYQVTAKDGRLLHTGQFVVTK